MSESLRFLPLIGRILIAVLFVPAGFQKLTGFQGSVGYAESAGMPVPALAIAAAIAIELGGGLLLLVGYKARWVAAAMALFTVVTGMIVLIGAVLTGRYQRVRETVLLRTLGATRRQLVQIQLVEYAILGALAALVGGALSVGGNALLAKFVFQISPSVPVPLLFAGGAVVCGVTIATGLLTSRGITDHPPLEVLRQET